MSTLIIIPAHNESKNITDLLNNLESSGVEKEDILVVNDHSTDDTSEICKKAGVSVIDLPCNLGIGGAVQTGYKYALKHNYDVAIQVDGDGQHNPGFIKSLIAKIESGEADLVIGSRYLEKKGFQSTRLRRIGIKYFNYLIYVLTNVTITDATSGFRACNSRVIQLFSEKYPQDYPEPESIVYLLRNRVRIKEVPVVMNERVEGSSSINSFKSIYYMIKVSIAILIDFMRKRTTI